MATSATSAPTIADAKRVSSDSPIWMICRALGSLKVTVVLFALSLILVLVGTLAQDKMNMLDVKEDYFLAWIAKLKFDHLVPNAFFQHDVPFAGWVPFPGGALIGVLLMGNLIFAKATRFKVQAKEGRLIAGLAFLVIGFGVTVLTVMSGSNAEGLQGAPPITFDQLWGVILAACAIGGAALLYGTTRTQHLLLRGVGGLCGIFLILFTVYSLATDFRIDDPGMRIVWQLMSGLNAAVILMIGCWLLFKKQGGNVLLHIGVALLMAGQFSFGDRQTEQRLNMIEGDVSNTFVNLDKIEFNFLNESADSVEVIAVPSHHLAVAAESGTPISNDSLPVDIKVVAFYENASLIRPENENLATTGLGLEFKSEKKDKSGGTDSQVDFAAAYVELLEKESGDSLGVFLVHQLLNDGEALLPGRVDDDILDTITVDETTYKIGLRLHREVKPYWVKLDDVARTNWSGTETPRDYSSFLRIIVPESNDDLKKRVWMNNPLRFRGETFYQSSYDSLPSGKETTGLQIVKNSGWMIPYMACSITALGMCVHFWGSLITFLGRRRRETKRESAAADAAVAQTDPLSPVDGQLAAPVTVHPESISRPLQNRPSPMLPVIAVSLIGFLALIILVPRQTVSNGLRPRMRDQSFDLYEAGKIPVQVGGRVMPLASYARQTLKAMTNKESIPLDEKSEDIRSIRSRADRKSKLSAIQWLFEVATDEPELRDLPMFRIDAVDVLTELELERRESKLYSLNELGGQLERWEKIVSDARKKDNKERTFKERKFIELDMRTRQYTLAAIAMKRPVPNISSPESFRAQFDAVFPPEQFAAMFPDGDTLEVRRSIGMRELAEKLKQLRSMDAPSIVPPPKEKSNDDSVQPKWTAFALGYFDLIGSGGETADDQDAPPLTFETLLEAFADENQPAFNSAIDKHIAAVQTYPVQGYSKSRVWAERWLDSQQPTTIAIILYIVCFVLCLVNFAVNAPRLGQFNWGLLLVAFLVHTIVVAARVYITGRAPVINLHSSAVFVGWAAVLFGLVVERIFSYGVATAIAAVIGTLTSMVAYYLTLSIGSADTMPVLQAVLDTQFWLTTHVISVSLGYVATILAGFLGIAYLVSSWLGASAQMQRDIYRITYSASCFGILLSFVGTVLGGLWADDSWGRFWGWDPKENGALLIVIWNALVLHARWDGMVKARGFAVLAIFGNIVTAWSWFGTNELGIGLHSYGFTEGTLLWLSIFFGINLLFIVLGTVINPTIRPQTK